MVKVAKALLVLSWIMLQVVLFQWHGVKIVFDSHRFILFATEVVTGQSITTQHVWRYIGYPVFLMPFIKAGISLAYAVWIQMALSALASFTLYKASKALMGKEYLALLATGMFALNPDLQAWNCYILTDSLFISLFTISVCLMVLPKIPVVKACLVPAILWATLVRPNGFILLLTIGVYLLVKHRTFSTYNKWLVGSLAISSLAVGYWVLDYYLLKTFTLMIPYERGDLIYGYYGFTLKQFHQPQIPPNTITPLAQVLWFAIVNPFYFTAIAVLKGFFFLIHAKPFYSLAHNVAIVAYLLPVHVLARRGWLKGDLSAPVKALLLSPIVLQASITMLTIEDWDGRWLYPILPLLLMLACVGFNIKTVPKSEF